MKYTLYKLFTAVADAELEYTDNSVKPNQGCYTPEQMRSYDRVKENRDTASQILRS